MQAVMVLSISLLSILIIASISLIIEARPDLPDVGNNDQGDQGNLRKPANEDQQREQQQRQQQSAAVPARGGVGQNAGYQPAGNQQQPPMGNQQQPPMNNQQAPMGNQQQPQMGNQQKQADDGQPHIIAYEQCRDDIARHCSRNNINVQSDMAVLECLQDAGASETEQLSSACEHLVWEFKVNLTTDERFKRASMQFCQAEMNADKNMQQCSTLDKPGYMLSCLLDFLGSLNKESKCYKFLSRTERLAFSDFRLIGPFVHKCGALVQKLECGSVEPPGPVNKDQRIKHSQGATVECLIQKLTEASRKQKDAMQMLDTECRHEIMRIAELQSEDFHLDRPLFFACREDRETFCRGVQSGGGRVFECLLQNRGNQQMTGPCMTILAERAALMGQDYRLAHPLMQGCAKEIHEFNCGPQSKSADIPEHFHLSWVLLCLENAAHTSNKVGQQCHHEMMTHRQMMMSEYRLSPEIVLTCSQDIQSYCMSKQGELEREGRTLHCLMEVASSRDEKRKLTAQCLQAVTTVIKIADIGSNYRVDRVLHASCRALIEGKCARDASTETDTLNCLMHNLEDHEMVDTCRDRLLEIQYFMARDWTLDPELYRACQQDAKQKCSALDQWHMQSNEKNKPDPGPLVLACLYRAAYNEQEPLQRDCGLHVRRVLRTRAVRVNLIPDIEENCRAALSEFCSTNVAKTQEMHCLQQHFEDKSFQDRFAKCYEVIRQYTEYESKDIKLNRALTKACHPVIATHCQELINEEIDNGDVMECLLEQKESPEMTAKCRSFVNHFELISMRDYQFSFKFKQGCAGDISKYCAGKGSDKGEIIRCLSTIMFEHRVLNNDKELSKECRKQLKTAYLQQQRFDDNDHKLEADPKLFKNCNDEIRDHCSMADVKNFEQLVECLRSLDPKDLGTECRASIFEREKIEAADNQFDDELQQLCKFDMQKFCTGYDPDRVIDCLSVSKITRQLRPKCQKIVLERMQERARDIRLRPSLLKACSNEMRQYCSDDYNKIQRPEYAQHQMQGVLIGCLRKQFASITGGRAHFSMDCQQEMTKLIIESEFDPKLDPSLYQACKSSIPVHCTIEVLTDGGAVDNVMECLKADFYKGVIQDRRCGEEISRRVSESMMDIHLDTVLETACAVDIKRFCNGVEPGQSRVIMCLLDALDSQNARMTKSCTTKLTERHKLWNRAHKDYKMEMPQNLADFAELVVFSPARNSLLTYLTLAVFILFIIGCCCGRATKRIKQELKNR